ncbi:beta-ketoacyl-ACP synthase III [Streptomyces hoynatensis]|uniref:Beta-ketoacyl-ACP synthase III n=2 Tax=Streptomyces hoynatensis TaxID=1141874 RepID=A0A3A9ZCL5_9ACTN|nr:beta-ketoacyl-ACP synthase III [Streptomyces hoynatensis]
MGSTIRAAAHHLPARVLANEELAARLSTSDAWIRSRVGPATRHLADPDETVAGMASAAAGKALAHSGLAPEEIDLVVVATSTTAERMPSTAARVAQELRVPTAAAFDVNAACSGFSHALAIADHALSAGAARHALVVGADKMSDFLDWEDRTSCVIFGDGAGAVVVSAAAAPAPGIGPVAWGSRPDLGDAVTIGPAPGRARPLFTQQGQSVYRWATTALASVARRACHNAGVAPGELAAFVPHQANLRIIESLARQLDAPGAYIARDIVDCGNTNAASIPIALSRLVERRAVPGDSAVLLLGFGAGLSFSAQVVRCP